MVQICVFLPTVGGDCANLHPDSRKPRVTNPKSDYYNLDYYLPESCNVQWLADLKAYSKHYNLIDLGILPLYWKARRIACDAGVWGANSVLQLSRFACVRAGLLAKRREGEGEREGGREGEGKRRSVISFPRSSARINRCSWIMPHAPRPLVSTGIFSLRHESSIFRSFIQPCMWFWKCQASSPWAKQYRA